jgi:hypothetical protein
MSKTKGFIELEIPEYGARHETLSLGGFKCPNCCQGKVRKYGKVSRLDEFVECESCRGSGRLNAHVTVDWYPARK